MIPWRLSFSGIRDYRPERLDLSGVKDHIMITGPNGSGKSTISFCIGAVLYSAKVDIHGLRSRNSSPEKSWQGSISLVFKNEFIRDMPAYIEFSLEIEQQPNQTALKKEYRISTGEEIDEWQDVKTYTSGDTSDNFSTYKEDLKSKYKIDPDLYYLIWYQQEVNQFAMMQPEERFRIFSNMYGIDTEQRALEESMRIRDEARDELDVVESNFKFMHTERLIKKADLNRISDNEARLTKGSKLYIEALMKLDMYYEREIDALDEEISSLGAAIKSAEDTCKKEASELSTVEQRLATEESYAAGLEADIALRNEVSLEEEERILRLTEEIKVLEEQSATILAKQQVVDVTEETAKTRMEQLMKEKTLTDQAFEQTTKKIAKLKITWENQVASLSELKQKILMDEKLRSIHEQRLYLYMDSHTVEKQIKTLETKDIEIRMKYYQAFQKMHTLKKELQSFRHDSILSKRQEESLKYFRDKGVKAYPLRKLIELSEEASTIDEQNLEAIKYTIFFNDTKAKPPNDLYHVGLMKLMPSRSVTSIRALNLRIRNDLSASDIPYAMKVLWWVEQFFQAKHSVSLENGYLIDKQGIRGQAEAARYILSEKAVKTRRLEIKQAINKNQPLLEELSSKSARTRSELQKLHSIVHQIRESEAFMTYEKASPGQESIKRADSEKTSTEKELKQSQEQLERLWLQQIEQKHEAKQLAGVISFYEDVGESTSAYEVLMDLEIELAQLLANQSEQRQMLKDKERALTLEVNEQYETLRKQLHIQHSIGATMKDIDIIHQQIKSETREITLKEAARTSVIEELTRIKASVSNIYKEVSEQLIVDEQPVAQLLAEKEKGRILFEQAQLELDIDPDPLAADTYGFVKQEHQRLNDDYQEVAQSLEQYTARAAKLKDRLMSIITLHVFDLQKRFKVYMEYFQLDGEISWHTYEDAYNRTQFSLFIKVRKDGHQGILEDVNTGGLGKLVGKGVSGGEESLSSLLFALALLSGMPLAPGFIVLDEFDSSLDEQRTLQIFDLYVKELDRKLIVLTPKSHDKAYVNRFTKAFIVQHDPNIPQSKILGLVHSKRIPVNEGVKVD